MKAPLLLLILTVIWFLAGLILIFRVWMNGAYLMSILFLPLVAGSLGVWLNQRWAYWLLVAHWTVIFLLGIFNFFMGEESVRLTKLAFAGGMAAYCLICAIEFEERRRAAWAAAVCASEDPIDWIYPPDQKAED